MIIQSFFRNGHNNELSYSFEGKVILFYNQRTVFFYSFFQYAHFVAYLGNVKKCITLRKDQLYILYQWAIWSVHSLQAGSNGEGPVSAGCHATLAPSGEETLSLCGRRMVQPIVRPAQPLLSPRIIGILS